MFNHIVCMYVINVFLYLLKSIHNMFYKATYNGITLKTRQGKTILCSVPKGTKLDWVIFLMEMVK